MCQQAAEPLAPALTGPTGIRKVVAVEALCFLKKNNLALILWMKSRTQHLASYMSRIRSLRTRWQLVKLGPGMM